MAQLIVRNLEEEVVRLLKKRAGKHGVSMEEEHRKILRITLFGDEKADHFWRHLGNMPEDGEDSIFARDRSLSGRATEQNLFAEKQG